MYKYYSTYTRTNQCVTVISVLKKSILATKSH